MGWFLLGLTLDGLTRIGRYSGSYGNVNGLDGLQLGIGRDGLATLFYMMSFPGHKISGPKDRTGGPQHEIILGIFIAC